MLGYDAECIFSLRMDSARVYALRRMVNDLGLLRFLVTTMGVTSVVMGMRVRSLDEVAQVEDLIRQVAPGAEIMSTQMTFGTTKLGSWVQENHGFGAVRFIQPPL